MNNLQQQLNDLFSTIPKKQLDLLPSEFAEKYRTLTSDVSTIIGKFKYDLTPYLREIVNTLAPEHPGKIFGIMKGAQVGLTDGLLVNGILWLIANNPGNIMSLSANDDLSKEMIESRLDQGIVSCGIQHLIRPNTIKKRNQRTGDTAKYKEFAGGRLFAGGLNSIDKLGKQRSIKTGFYDDWDAAKIADKQQGNLFELIQQRFSTAANTMKQYYISTPETRPSNIEKVYLMGDQRKWHVPCPKCGTYIEILWHKKIDNEKVGIIFDKDKLGNLIESSVGYVCQECGNFFKEKHKYDINLVGQWTPTATASRPGLYSYHIPCFVSAPGMYSWTDYAYKWIDIYRDGSESTSKRKVFKNVVEGLPWEERQIAIKTNQLAKNTRNYQVGTVPQKLCEEDGNGHIVLLTCAGDLHGNDDDCRLDYEVVGHSTTGSQYSITHGSIGTFYSGNKNQEREIVSCRNGIEGNVWDRFFNEIIDIDYPTDDNNTLDIKLTAVDYGHMAKHVARFMNDYPGRIIGVKGKSYDDRYKKISSDTRNFKPSSEMPNLYILEVDQIKDQLAANIEIPKSKPQNPGFMNFPTPEGGKYTARAYFAQYEAEEKIIEVNDDGEKIGWKWTNKKNRANHYFDCAVYNLALRDIISFQICKELKIAHGSWDYFCGIMNQL